MPVFDQHTLTGADFKRLLGRESPDEQTLRKEGTPERPDEQTLRKEGTPERPDEQPTSRAGRARSPLGPAALAGGHASSAGRRDSSAEGAARPAVHPTFGGYSLIEEIACRAPDVCFHAWPPGKSGWASPLFLRTFPREIFTAPVRDWLQRHAAITEHGIESIFSLDIVADRGLIASEYIFGASLADVGRVVAASGRPLSWGMALALFGAVLVRLARLHASGVCHGRITPALVRLTVDGEVWLCRGLPHAIHEQASVGEPLSRTQRDRDLVALGRAVLPLAAGPRADQVAALFTGRDRQAFAVLSDLIIEGEPAISELAVAVLWPLGEPGSDIPVDRASQLVEQALARLQPSEVGQLLEIVTESSPDYQRAHIALAMKS